MTPYLAAALAVVAVGAWLVVRAVRATARASVAEAERARDAALRDLADERATHAATAAAHAATKDVLAGVEAECVHLRDALRARETGAEAWDRIAAPPGRT